MNAPGLGGKDFLKDTLLTFIMKARILNPSHNIRGKTSKDEKAHSTKHKYMLPLFDDQLQVKPVCLETGD